MSAQPDDLPRRRRPKATIGGGYIVLRRGETTSKLRGQPFPYEHGSFEQAKSEALRLAGLTGREFVIFAQAGSVRVPVASSDAEAA